MVKHTLIIVFLLVVAYPPRLTCLVHSCRTFVRSSPTPDLELKEEEYPQTTTSLMPQGNDRRGRRRPQPRPL